MSAGPFIVDGHVVMAPAPDGWEVNLENPTRDESTIRSIWWTLGFGNAIAVFFLAQNLYVKWIVQRELHIETLFLLISWPMGIFVMAYLIDTIRIQTTGSHMWEVKMENFEHFVVVYYVCSTVYSVQLALVKCALALFYRRISPARWWQFSIYGLLGVITVFTIIITFISLFACNPIAKSWDLSITTGSCLNRNAMYITIAATHVLLDIVLILLPIPVIIGLQMTVRQKIGLIVIFVIGGSTVVSSSVRLGVLVPLLDDPDQTWGMTKAILCIVIECNLLVICATLPTLRRFTSIFAPTLLGESFRSKDGHTPGYKSGPQGNSNGFRTFGQGSDRHQLDEFGMTVNHDPKDEEPHAQALELKDLGCGDPVEVQVVAEGRKDHASRQAPTHQRKHNEKARDAASTSSDDNYNNNDGLGNNSTWDPVTTIGDEQAIIQTRTYAVHRETRHG